jgi:hypothetical protein
MERWDGTCGKRAADVCPESFETYEEYEAAQITAAEYADLAAEAKWEQQQERRYEKRIL